MADYLKIARAALELATKAAEARPEIAPSAESPKIEASPDPAEAPSPEPSLKGQAVELWRDGSRFFIVADEQDAQETIRRFGARRGEVWIPAEIELVARFKDQSARDEIAAFKRQMDGVLRPDTLPRPKRGRV
jgi:hypothetical protein